MNRQVQPWHSHQESSRWTQGISDFKEAVTSTIRPPSVRTLMTQSPGWSLGQIGASQEKLTVGGTHVVSRK